MSDDDILDSYLAGDSELSDLYRSTPQSVPSKATDQAILAAARRSTASRPQAVSPAADSPAQHAATVKTTATSNTTTKPHRSMLSRWFVPLSLAATVVLSTSLYLTNQPQWLDSSSQAPSSYDEGARPALRSQPKTEHSAPSMLKNKMAEETASEVSAGSAADSAEDSAAELTAKITTESAANYTTRPKQAQIDKKQAAMSAAAGTEPSETQMSQSLILQAQTLQPQTLQSQLNQPRLESSVDAAGVSRQLSPTVTTQALELVPLDYHATPASWLQKIIQLLVDGEQDSAQNEFDSFRAQYPDHPLPEQLSVLKR